MGEAGGGMPHRASHKIFVHAYELRHNQTDAESKLWYALKTHHLQNIHFRRQHPIGPYIVDFCAPRHKIIIEVDGEQHLEQQEYDLERTNFLESNGFRVLRFRNVEVIENLAGVTQTILEAVMK
jgi:very-short-patch-repair endonuclease